MRRIKLARLLQRLAGFLPRKYPLRDTTGIQQPFFVLGSGRNGSTMLNRMLNQHTDLFLPSEQYFLGISIIKYKLYNNFLIWRDLMKIVGGELMHATTSHTWNFDANEVIQDLFLIKAQNLQAATNLIYRKYGAKLKGDFSFWGDTTPLNTRYTQEVYSLFPKAKYIFLIRDGRDVVASYKKAGPEYLGSLASPEEALVHWENAIAKYDWLVKRTNVLQVKYEELVSRPEVELKRVCEFLNVEFQAKMLEFYQEKLSAEMYREPQHSNLSKPIFTNSIGRWKDILTRDEKILVEKMHANLARFGYL